MSYNGRMKKIRYSQFESINDVIGQIDFKYDAPLEAKKQQLFDEWMDVVGKKLSAVSKPIEVTKNNVLIISCANSFIANELFLVKNNLLELLQEKVQDLNIEINDLKFDYMSWSKQK